MTVFNAFLRVIRKNIPTIIIYTVIVLAFAVINTQTSGTDAAFSASKPGVAITDNDKSAISRNLCKYMEENCELSSVTDPEALDDALFYREINYRIIIPKGYGEGVIKGTEPELTVYSTGEYNSTLANMLLERYVRIQNGYGKTYTDEQTIINKINAAMDNEPDVEIMTKLDTGLLKKTATYFSFASYSIMACILFIICLVLSSFNEKNIKRRTVISSMNYKKYSFHLYLCSGIYAAVVWLFFSAAGCIVLKISPFSARPLCFILNAFVFTISVLSMSLLLSTILRSKPAVTGIVNVLSLGSAFLCGAFVPSEYLPDWVIGIGHALPSYWYINTNERLAAAETLRTGELNNIVINMAVMTGFAIVFAVAALMISQMKRKS